MLSRVLRTIRLNRMFADAGQQRVLCAVSGGADSMAMLACLWELSTRLGLTIEVATVDHGLRAGSADELRQVAERCAALGVPWHALSVDVAGARGSALGAGGKLRRGGIQEVARRLRLAALSELAVRRGLGSVALGHQADDQTETILFRILRGTGIDGVTGIPHRRDPFVRPLLDVTRGEIAQYLARRSLPHATDPSNDDLRYARARIRHRILPLLRQENPRVDRALRSLASSVAAAGAGRAAGVSEAVAPHIPLRVREEIAAAEKEGRGTKIFHLPQGKKVTVAYGRIEVCSPGGARRALVPGTVNIFGPGCYAWGDQSTVVVRDWTGPDHAGGRSNDGAAIFDGDCMAWPLSVRRRLPGDRMRPRGGNGTRKLSDLLIDAKVPLLDRGLLPVVVGADGEVLFVPGVRPSRVGAPSTGTRRWIALAAGINSDHDALVDRAIVGSNTETVRSLKRTSWQVDD